MIPFQDLGRLHASVGPELEAAMASIMSSSAFIGGPTISEFEREFADAHSVRGCVTCGSGTDALTISLLAAGLRPGDEVIVPALTFIATAEAVVHAGGVPVIADVEPDTLLLSPATVDRARTEKTRAVLPVHLYGHTVPTAHLDEWRRTGLLVVEDAAQAHLATDGGASIGAASDAACFSFYPGKNLGAMGDGGALISNSPHILELARSIRDHGRRDKYLHERVGFCSRLDGLQAAVLRVKLRYLNEWTESRRVLAKCYAAEAERLGIELVPWRPGDVHHLLVARVPSGERERVRGVLAENGVQTGIHYPVALCDQPALEPVVEHCPNAEQAASEVLSLPMDPLMSNDEVRVVCGSLAAALSPR